MSASTTSASGCALIRQSVNQNKAFYTYVYIRNNCRIKGVTALLAGGFQQFLPVIPRETRADEVKVCVKRSHLWPSVTKLSLTKNMIVHLRDDVNTKQFSNMLLQIGNFDFPGTG